MLRMHDAIVGVGVDLMCYNCVVDYDVESSIVNDLDVVPSVAVP